MVRRKSLDQKTTTDEVEKVAEREISLGTVKHRCCSWRHCLCDRGQKKSMCVNESKDAFPDRDRRFEQRAEL